MNFGDVYFPKDLALGEKDKEILEEEALPEDLPPPLIEPVHNAHDPNRHDHDWKDDSDVPYAAAEAESSAPTLRMATSTLVLLVGAYLL